MEESPKTPLSIAINVDVKDNSNLRPNAYACRICKELPTDPIATSCGHIFCWPCIYLWLQNGPKPCPICKTNLNRDKNILSLYGTRFHMRPTNGNDNVAKASTSNSVIPPRQRNQLSFDTRATSNMEASYRFYEGTRAM